MLGPGGEQEASSWLQSGRQHFPVAVKLLVPLSRHRVRAAPTEPPKLENTSV